LALSITVLAALLLASVAVVAGAKNDRGSRAGLDSWALLTSERFQSAVPLFNSLADLSPQSKTAKGFHPADVVIEGRLVRVEPGIAYASGGDALASPIVPYNSQDAAFRWVVLDVQVDSVLSGRLHGQQTGDVVKIETPQPAGVTVQDLEASLNPSETVFFLSNAYDMFERDGQSSAPEVDPVYHKQVQRIIGDAVFVRQSDGGIEAPYMDPPLFDQLVGGKTTFSELVNLVSEAASPAA